MSKILKKLRKKFHNKSFTLVEVIIAIFVITIGVIGGIFAIQQTIILASYSSSRLIAAYLAQEGIEIVRNIRDTNWLNGANWTAGLENCGPPSGCRGDYTSTFLTSNDPNKKLKIFNNLYQYSNGQDTPFQRRITIASSPDGYLEITVDVSWEERGKTHSFPSLKERLYNWY